jgi:mono/diheme cytochrome c family protein
VSNEPIAPFTPLKVDAELAARGRESFTKFGCANCHDDLKAPLMASVPFSKLDPARGCLSTTSGAWPRFDLSAEQRALIVKVLPHVENSKLDDSQQIDSTLAKFNCIACHERTDVGGIAPDRNALFTSTQPALGDQGRIPPPLSHVGAKLTPQWLGDVLLRGKRQRDYVEASMPQFGEANVGRLVELFGKVDHLEAAVFPKVNDIQESKAAGYELIGTGGLSCIACHEFNGQKAGEMSALDIARVPERLQKNWFALYMRQPSRFHPTVIMPSFWPDGKSTRPTILGGDTGLQIEALWSYLGDGIRAKKPLGLSRQTNELRVGDVAEISRGHGPAGYRGIAVGYPERISLAFDSGEMALRQIWKGDFASVDIGAFHPRGTDTISFPPGIPFHRLASLDDQWPYKAKTNHAFPQDHGYEFRGYRLDAKRRPTFTYQYGAIAVEDFFEDVRDGNGSAYFKRVLTFDSPAAQPPFYFRAGAGKSVAKASEREFTIDKLRIRITSDHKGVVREGESADVLIPITVPAGRSSLVLEYRW